MKEAPELLTAKEAAAIIRVCNAQMYALLNANLIPGAFKLRPAARSCWRIQREPFVEWLRTGGLEKAHGNASSTN